MNEYRKQQNHIYSFSMERKLAIVIYQETLRAAFTPLRAKNPSLPYSTKCTKSELDHLM